MLIGISQLAVLADWLTPFVNVLTWAVEQDSQQGQPARYSANRYSFVRPDGLYRQRQTEESIPWRGECDVDVLTWCHQSSSPSLVFKDLDTASYDSFVGEPFHGSRVVLYHATPSFVDALFVTTTASNSGNDDEKNNETGTNWLQMKDNDHHPWYDVSPIVGRVNCDQEPSLCYYNNQIPTMEVFRWVNTTEDQLGEQKAAAAIDDYVKLSFTKRLESYGPDSSACLLRRYGAGILHHEDCRVAIDHWQQQQQQQQPLSSPDMDGTILVMDHHPALSKWIQQGRNIALAWNTAVITMCGILLLCLAYAVRSLVRKCVARFCRRGCSGSSVLSSSPAFVLRLLERDAKSTEERQRLDLEMVHVWCGVILFAVLNMFFPVMLLFVAGPVTLGAVAWMGVEVVRAWRAGNHDF
jgi:hypothetical protein